MYKLYIYIYNYIYTIRIYSMTIGLSLWIPTYLTTGPNIAVFTCARILSLSLSLLWTPCLPPSLTPLVSGALSLPFSLPPSLSLSLSLSVNLSLSLSLCLVSPFCLSRCRPLTHLSEGHTRTCRTHVYRDRVKGRAQAQKSPDPTRPSGLAFG